MPISTSSFQYARKYSVDNSQEFAPGIDTIFNVEYSIPDPLEDLKADNFLVNDNIYLNGQLWDKFSSTGSPGQILITDSAGVYWGNVSSASTPLQTIAIYDEGVFKATVSAIDFKDGSDPTNLVNTTISLSNVAEISISDRWSLNGVDIYRNSKVGINNSSPAYTLDVSGDARFIGPVYLNSTLDVEGNTIIKSATSSSSKDTGALIVSNGGVGIEEDLNIGRHLNVLGITTLSGFTFIDDNLVISGFTTGTISTSLYSVVSGASTLSQYSNLSGVSTYSNVSGVSTLSLYSNLSGLSTYSNLSGVSTFAVVSGFSTFSGFSNLSGISSFVNTIQTSSDVNYYIPFVQNSTSTVGETIRIDPGFKYNPFTNSVTIDGNLSIGGTSVFNNSIELKSSLIDSNGSTAIGKTDYRLASVGTGVSWRPPGVQTQNAIWVTMDGDDSNSGYLEGDAKRTIGAAASIAEPGDTIFIRSGVYYENNPIGLRTDVSISGQDLRLVTIVPINPTKDVFHVRRGCLIENLNFAGSNVSVAHTNCGAVAFPPTNPSDYAVTGYIAAGPATEGPSGRWRSPYVRNCTNFMTGSIGMKINGDHATASTIGADLKSMVCDSFTQYNENGIGVSITNNGYAQLVSIFTINCDVGIYCDTGGSCDLTNSNSSFGNFGLVAVGLGSTEFTGKVIADTNPETDIVGLTSVFDYSNSPRRPYDGQALWFKINLDNYPDAQGSGIISSPLLQLDSITVTNGGSGYSSAAPPSVLIVDLNDLTQSPKGPQGIIAEASPTIDDATGSITSIEVTNSGRNYLSTQNIGVIIEGTGGATAVANMTPIYYTISDATQPTSPTGITTVTFNEFIPYELFEGDEIELRRISRILTSSHSFEYIGTGTDINTSTPFLGAVPIKANEVVARDGAQIPFTSTDQKGNFDIGKGIQVDQTTSVIRGRDFSRAIQAEVTPLILALR